MKKHKGQYYGGFTKMDITINKQAGFRRQTLSALSWSNTFVLAASHKVSKSEY